MAVSSANRSGHPASRTVLDAASQLGASVEFYLDGGPVTGGLASTIVDCTREEPVILRRGALSDEDVLAVVETARAQALELTGVEPDAPPPAEPDAPPPAEPDVTPSTDSDVTPSTEQRESTQT